MRKLSVKLDEETYKALRHHCVENDESHQKFIKGLIVAELVRSELNRGGEDQ